MKDRILNDKSTPNYLKKAIGEGVSVQVGDQLRLISRFVDNSRDYLIVFFYDWAGNLIIKGAT